MLLYVMGQKGFCLGLIRQLVGVPLIETEPIAALSDA